MSFSNYLETAVLGHVFGGTAYTQPTKYVALLTAVSDGEAGTVTEVSTSGTGYARVSASFSVTGDTASNSASIEFATATASYGTVTHVGVYDASTGGNLLCYAALSASKAIDTGDVFRIPTGDLDITLG